MKGGEGVGSISGWAAKELDVQVAAAAAAAVVLVVASFVWCLLRVSVTMTLAGSIPLLQAPGTGAICSSDQKGDHHPRNVHLRHTHATTIAAAADCAA